MQYKYQSPKYTKKQELRIKEEARMHQLIHDHYNTAGRYPLFSHLEYYGFYSHDIPKIITILTRRGSITVENEKIIAHVPPKKVEIDLHE